MNRFLACSSVVLLLSGCVASKSSLDDGANLNAGSSDDTGGTSEGGSASGTAGMTSTSGPDTATTAMTTGANPTSPTTNDDDQSDEGGIALDVAVESEECAAVDHDNCYFFVMEACQEPGEETPWDSEECYAAVATCYPMGTSLLASSVIVDLCKAELEETCLASGGPGCSEQLCSCTAGDYPFDWDNCFHLLQAGCVHGDDSDCPAVLESCYPGETIEDFDACYQAVVEADGECNCPACGLHDACEASLTECLAG